MGKKNANEITVKVKCELDELYKTLKERGFEIVDRFNLDDTFFIQNDLELESMTTREILSKAVLVRQVTADNRLVKLITFKKKEFDEKGKY